MQALQASTSRFVQAGTLKLHYHEAGQGPVLLCIHGGAPGAFGWGNFGRNLPTLSRYYRTLIVDLPGYGKSAKPVIAGDRTAAYARMFIEMLDALSIERAHVMGMATGGAVAMQMAIQWPGRIDKLVVINSPGGLSLFSGNKPRPVSHDYYGGDGPSREKMRAILSRLVYDPAVLTEDIVNERYEASIEPSFMEQAPEGKGGEPGRNIARLWDKLDSILAPTLIVWGRENPSLGTDQALFFLSRIRNAQLIVYGQCGLWAPYEKQDTFNRNVIDFLSPAARAA